MPFVHKPDRTREVQTHASLSPEGFRAKPQTVPPLKSAGKNHKREHLLAALADCNRRFELERHACLRRDRDFALREPDAAYLVILVICVLLCLILGSMVILGFRAVNPTLAILPAGMMIIALTFMLRSLCVHYHQWARMKLAKRRYGQTRTSILMQLARLDGRD